MKRVLIVFHSKYGQTKKIARFIADTLQSTECEVDVLDLASLPIRFPLDSCAALVIGAPLYQANHSNRLKKYIKANLDFFNHKPSAFFSVSLSAAGNDEQKSDATRCLNQFLSQTGWQPNLKTIVAGGIPYGKYNWFVRWIMKRIVKSSGGDTDTSKNHEYTDWQAVREFAQAISALIDDSASGASTGKSQRAKSHTE